MKVMSQYVITGSTSEWFSVIYHLAVVTIFANICNVDSLLMEILEAVLLSSKAQVSDTLWALWFHYALTAGVFAPALFLHPHRPVISVFLVHRMTSVLLHGQVSFNTLWWSPPLLQDFKSIVFIATQSQFTIIINWKSQFYVLPPRRVTWCCVHSVD